MLDILIQNGVIVDGTGAPSRSGDIGVRGGQIVEMGERITTPARETIDAEGKLVTPGFVDVHTHYDGQVMWDDKLDSSFSNGVTTAVAGNCGVGFAPFRPEFRTELIEMMEGVEDIPGIVLSEGLDWSWRSFPSYLDKVAERQYTMDVAFQITHAPLRVYVMGERAIKHEQATPEDIAEMARLVREAMEHGAVGFSAARLLDHKSSRGEFVPGTFSDIDELGAIAKAMGETGKGVLQVIPLGAAGDMAGNGSTPEERLVEHERMVALAKAANRPLSYVLLLPNENPDDRIAMMRATEAAVREGVQLYPQVHARGVGLLATLGGNHTFILRPSYLKIAHLPLAERAAAMRTPELRAAILSEKNIENVEEAPSVNAFYLVQLLYGPQLPRFYLMSLPLDYEPARDKRIDAIAERTGKSMEAVLYDHLVAGDGRQFAAYFAQNYGEGDLAATGELLDHPNTRFGLADGGAHLQVSCDAALPTFLLTHWVRDRSRGKRLKLEQAVRMLTLDNASLYDMHDRGVLEVGKRADINVIDFDNLQIELPEMRNDLPEGGTRLTQFSKGYVATIVNGVVTRRNDQDTGARPGRLYRS